MRSDIVALRPFVPPRVALDPVVRPPGRGGVDTWACLVATEPGPSQGETGPVGNGWLWWYERFASLASPALRA
jgi:hypothetical protein